MKMFRSASVFLVDKALGKPDYPGFSGEGLSAFHWAQARPEDDFSIGYLFTPETSSVGQFSLIQGKIRLEKKIPPRSLVNDLVGKKVRKIRNSGRVVSREDQAAFRLEETRKLIPQTLPSYTDIRFAFVAEKNHENKPAYILFDRSQGLDVEHCISLMVRSNLMSKSYRAMIPSKFYGNLVEHLFNGKKEIGKYRIGDIFEISSEDRGLYEASRGTSPLILNENEYVSSVFLEDANVKFALKRDGLMKSISFSRSNLGADEQILLLIKIIEDMNKGEF